MNREIKLKELEKELNKKAAGRTFESKKQTMAFFAVAIADITGCRLKVNSTENSMRFSLSTEDGEPLKMTVSFVTTSGIKYMVIETEDSSFYNDEDATLQDFIELAIQLGKARRKELARFEELKKKFNVSDNDENELKELCRLFDAQK